MKVYLITQKDLDLLLANVDRNPKHGFKGGSSQCFSKEETEAQDAAHRFYNYQVRTWIDEIKKD